MTAPKIHRYPNLDACCQATAEIITEAARKNVATKGFFTMVLAGGTTPRLLHQYLSAPPFSDLIPWKKTYLFWGDERMVPHTHPDSNYAMAHDTLISKIDIPTGNIYPMPVKQKNHKTGAAAYQKSIENFFAKHGTGNQSENPDGLSPPALSGFDIILLGMGLDGHTASLFPGQPALTGKKELVVAVQYAGASPPVPRLTMTLPLINNAACVLFLISGAEKIRLLQQIIDDPQKASRRYPAALVRPRGRLLWLAAEE